LTSTTYYRVKITYNGCFSYAYFTVNIFPQITIGTISSNPASPICCGTATVLTLSGTYPAGTTFKWQKGFVLGSFHAYLAGSYISGANGNAYTTGNLTTATWYRVEVTDENGCIKTAEIRVIVKPKPPTITLNGSTIVCYGASASLTLVGVPHLGATIAWQSSTDGVTFATINGATSYIYTPTNLSTTTYQAIITYNGCPITTNTATITVTPPAILGPITGNTTVCYNGSTLLTAPSTCSGALYQWQVSNHNGPYFPILGATSATYTAVLAGHDASYKVTVKCPGGCGCIGITPEITVHVGAFIETGTIAITSGSNIVCSGDSTTTMTLSGNIGTIQWHSSTDNFVANDTVLAGTGPIITVSNITTTTYYRAVITNAEGCSAPSDVQVINIAPIPQLTVQGCNQVCSKNAATITVSGYQPTSSFEWQSSSDGITWNYVTNGSGFTTDSYTTPNLDSTTYYRVLVNTPYACYSFSPVHTVTVGPNDLIGGSLFYIVGNNAPTPAPAPGTILDHCINRPLNLSLSGFTPGSTLQWMLSTDYNGPGYHDIPGATSANYTPVAPTIRTLDAVHTSFYAVRVTSPGPCGCYTYVYSLRVFWKDNCRTAMSTTDKFNVVSSPNPFISNFSLNLTTSSKELVQIKVYDMLGKLVEEQEVKPIDVSALKIGTSNYPSGVYNVIVTQGAEKKTLRVIKN
jgi:Secretion system C-terminal sorting domain